MFAVWPDVSSEAVRIQPCGDWALASTHATAKEEGAMSETPETPNGE